MNMLAALRSAWRALAAKITNAPREDSPHHAQFVEEVKALTAALAEVGDYHAGAAVRRAHERLRQHIAFMHRDRAMDGDVRMVCELIARGAVLDGAA